MLNEISSIFSSPESILCNIAFKKTSLPNMVRSPYTSRLRTHSEDVSVSQEHESFIMDLDPVEENDEC